MTSHLAATVVEALKLNGLRLTTAESCTGGMVAEAITSVSGASDVFDAGFVTYANSAKSELIGVSKEILEQFGAVSEPVAAAMSEGALKAAHADVAISITGIAGPTGGTAEKPVGMVCFGLSRLMNGQIHTETKTEYFGNLGRDNVRQKAKSVALNWVKSAI